MTYQNYQFTALTEAELLRDGDTNLGCGDTFTMPGSASLCITVCDNDGSLSGDGSGWYNEVASDWSGQHATIEGDNGDIGNGCPIYAEVYHWVQDQDGNRYVMIEIEQEGTNADYFTFHTGYGTPPAGAELTIISTCNVSGCWVDYQCLDAGDKIETGTVSGTVFCDTDCDGEQEIEVTYTKGDDVFCDSVTFESVSCTSYNVSGYGSWYSVGAQVIDLVVGADQGHNGNACDNTLVELDQGGVWCRGFNVAEGGKYCLVFDVYENSCVDADGNKFDVKINGVTIENVTVTEDGKVEIAVDLNAGYNRIDFVSQSNVYGYGAGIDNIQLQELEETVTYLEPTKEGVTVKLIDAATGDVVATTTTDANGNYEFADVPVGEYKIMGVAPDGTEFTIKDAVSDDVDSDVDENGMSDTFTVTAGGNTDIDLGLCDKPEVGSLSGRYFCDTDNDDQDNGNGNEPGIAGVVVELLDAAGNGTGITTVTAADGSYSFTDLAPGSYGVRFTDPDNVLDGKALVNANVGDDASDSDAIGDTASSTIENITVVGGQDTPDNDAGVEKLGSLSGRYFCDTDNDDQDNGNGNEPGVEGITVELLDATGNPTGRTTTTDANGNYSFAGLVPAVYGVRFTDPDGVVADKVLVNANVGDDASDSDAIGDNTSSTIENITVVGGQDTPDNDAGVEKLGSLSGRYFCDTDDDSQDNNNGDEPGVAGITVELLDATGNPTGATTVTAADGSYSFAGLVPGSYGVRFTDPDGVVADKVLVDANVGDDASDSDAIGDNTSSTIQGITVVGGQDTPDNDAGVEKPNEDPTATDDAGKGCADTEITVDLSDNYADADSASVSITMLAGQNIADGQTILVDGTDSNGNAFTGLEITRDGDAFIFDGESAFAALDIGEEASATVEFKVEDSDGGTATASVEVTFCGDANSVDSLYGSIPSSIDYQVVSGLNTTPQSDGGFDIKISGTGDARFDGVVVDAYCLSFLDPANVGGDFGAAPVLGGDMFGSQTAQGAGVFNANQVSSFNGQTAADNLDLINYIISQCYEDQAQYNGWEVQFAIWELTDNFDSATAFNANPVFGDLADTQAILADAAANGEGFVAGTGDKVGVIIDPNPVLPENSQPFIYGINFEDYDCLC